MTEKNGVSLILCCYNSSTRIVKTLQSIQNLTPGEIPWEVVLVDNASDDDTVKVAQSCWEKKPIADLKVVHESKKGLMHARIKGVQSAAFDIFSFIDDDNWVEEHWVVKVHSIMNGNPDLAACGGSSEAVFETNAPHWFNEFSHAYAVGFQQEHTGLVGPERGFLWGAGLTIRRAAWEQLFKYGFVSLLPGRTGTSLTSGEDSELCLSYVLLGWKLWYEKELKLKHFIPKGRLTEPYLLRVYEGFGKAETILAIYRKLIARSPNWRYSWTINVFTAIKNLVVTSFKYIFSGHQHRLKNQIIFTYNKAYTVELLLNMATYNHAKKNIIDFFKTTNTKNKS